MKQLHRNNLTKLRDYVKKLYGDQQTSEFFNMELYAQNKGTHIARPIDAICNTCCCLAGHGPQAGIAPYIDEEWDDYVNRCFVGDNDSPEWYYLFDTVWPDDIQFAIWRLDQVLSDKTHLLIMPRMRVREKYRQETGKTIIKWHTD